MPIQVYIEVNGKPTETLHITRLTNNKTTNVYAAVLKGNQERTNGVKPIPYPTYTEWEQEAVKFEHTVGDGLLTCVEKALNTVEEHRKHNR